MPESFSNLIFILIAVAIFIIRMVAQSQKKPPEKPRIPVHFEDDTAGQFIKNKTAEARKKNPAPLITEVRIPPPAVSALERPAANTSTRPVSPARRGAFNLNHLSPLKQAVVMAEILGPPKGLL